MDIIEIRSSGLLELFVMDQLSTAERAEVEQHLNTYPELRGDLREIERALEIYAKSIAVNPPAALKTKILDSLRDEFKPDVRSGGGGGGFWSILAVLFGLGLIGLAYLFSTRNTQLLQSEQALAALQDTCQSEQQRLNDRLNRLEQLTAPQNEIFAFAATPGFPSTDIYLHHNTVTKRNFIQVRNLPALTDSQSYELWSIKPNSSPAPLDVFETVADGFIEVQYVEGAEVYAITIEPRGGQPTPTLSNTIATVAVGGN